MTAIGPGPRLGGAVWSTALIFTRLPLRLVQDEFLVGFGPMPWSPMAFWSAFGSQAPAAPGRFGRSYPATVQVLVHASILRSLAGVAVLVASAASAGRRDDTS